MQEFLCMTLSLALALEDAATCASRQANSATLDCYHGSLSARSCRLLASSVYLKLRWLPLGPPFSQPAKSPQQGRQSAVRSACMFVMARRSRGKSSEAGPTLGLQDVTELRKTEAAESDASLARSMASWLLLCAGWH